MDKAITQVDQQIPELLDGFSASLRQGYSVRQCLELASIDLPEPIASEIKRVAADLQSGSTVQDALEQWLTRVPSENLNLFIATLNAQHETGGNLADKLELLGQIIQKRKQL